MNKFLIPFVFAISLVSISCKTTAVNESQLLEEKVSVDDTWKYLEQFQKIANQNNNNRAVGSPGGIASTDYIVKVLKDLNLNPVLQEFTNSKGKKGVNVIVEIKGKTDKVTMLGAHYDSVEFGPGINDNATGTAIVLEIISKIVSENKTPNHTLRFAFWDSEEIGVAGSKYYVSQLSNSDLSKIANYLNVDMVGTTKPTILISDGDGTSWQTFKDKLVKNSETEEDKANAINLIETLKSAYPAQVKGAEKLEKIYGDYLTANNVEFTEDYTLSNSTDVFPFLGKVPTFGFIMTNEQELETGESLYAPCYHQACDDIKNVDKTSLKIALESMSHLLNEVAIK